jgi:hypothetical protein
MQASVAQANKNLCDKSLIHNFHVTSLTRHRCSNIALKNVGMRISEQQQAYMYRKHVPNTAIKLQPACKSTDRTT